MFIIQALGGFCAPNWLVVCLAANRIIDEARQEKHDCRQQQTAKRFPGFYVFHLKFPYFCFKLASIS